MSQIIGKFYRFEKEAGNWKRDDICVNAIDVADLDGSLIIFRVKNKEAVEYLDNIFSKEIVENIGATIVVLRDDIVSSIDIIDVDEAEKMVLRKLGEYSGQISETTYDDILDEISDLDSEIDFDSKEAEEDNEDLVPEI